MSDNEKLWLSFGCAVVVGAIAHQIIKQDALRLGLTPLEVTGFGLAAGALVSRRMS